MRSVVELEEKRRLGYVRRREGERAAAAPRPLGADPTGYPSRAVGNDRGLRAVQCDARGRAGCAENPPQSEFPEFLPAAVERRARRTTASAPRALGPQARGVCKIPALAQRLPHHRLRAGGREGKGNFVLLAIEWPEVARVQLPFPVAPGFDGGLIYRQHLTLQNGGQQRVGERLQQLRRPRHPLGEGGPTQADPRLG